MKSLLRATSSQLFVEVFPTSHNNPQPRLWPHTLTDFNLIIKEQLSSAENESLIMLLFLLKSNAFNFSKFMCKRVVIKDKW